MQLFMYEVTDNKGNSTHRFAVDTTDHQKHVDRLKKELAKSWNSEIRSSGWTNISGVLENWGYEVKIEKAPATN